MSDRKSAPSRSGRRWWGLLLVLVVAGAAGYWWFSSTASDGAPGRPAGPPGPGGRPGFGAFGGPVPVRVAVARTGAFEVFSHALGTVTPLNTVNVKSRVAGELVELRFEEGQRVEAGDLLAVIDPRPYKVALAQAEGALLQNQALLKNAQVDLARYKGLFANDSVARQTLDTQQALVEQYQGTLASNRAAVDEARLNLEFTQIRAPIAGRLGLRQIDVGNLVTANADTPLVVITQTQPMSIAFTLPEGELAPILQRFRRGEQLLVQAWDRGNTRLLGEGVLQSLDNQIDTTTGTLRLKARFDNADEVLLPNQFVNVRLRVETREQALLVPSAAVQYGTRGTFVYVVGEGDKVELRTVTLGPNDGPTAVIVEGLAAGERIVLEGTDRLRDGAQVEVVAGDGVAPAAAGATPGRAGERPAGQRPQGERPAGALPAGERPAR